jgi:serine/threonine protein kinase/tetratricopeptide (TPR) repeat protein
MSERTAQGVAELFQAALLRDGAQRTGYLARECEGRPELLSEVVALLQCDEEAGVAEFWGSSAVQAEAIRSAQETEVIGQTIGPYKLLEEISSGGMGTVYLAVRDDAEYQKCVALKLIKRGMDTKLTVERFRNERQILASLEHPNIAHLLDGGTTADGLPYLVMEYVEGQPITDYADHRQLSIPERLALFRTVCSAVEYAHQNLVVHRDLKSSNILVTQDGIPKLLDFGIAKLLAADQSSEGRDATVTMLRFMTPESASPEQVKGETITTVSDVYSLGVLLYRLLSGRRPYRLKSHRPEDIAIAICTQVPEKPSTAAGRPEPDAPVASDVRKLQRCLRGDLDNIVLMALRKEPQRRYASVMQLSEDIRRYLKELPVTAHRATLGYRSGKFVRRHHKAAAAVGLLTVLLLAGVVGIAWEAHVARVQRARAERRFNDVRKLANSFLFELPDSLEKIPGTLAARQLILKRALEYLDSLAQEAGDDFALNSELAEAYDRVGTLTWDVGAAFEAHRKALSINRRLAEAQPANRYYREQLCNSYVAVAEALKDRGDTAGALANLLRAVAVIESLVKSDPANGKYLFELASTYEETGLMLERIGRVDESLTFQYKTLALRKSRLIADPSNVDARRQVMTIYLMIARGLTDNGDFKTALEETRKSRETTELLNKIDPANAVFQRDLWVTDLRLGGLLSSMGDPSGALPHYRRGLASITKLSTTDPGDKGHRHALAITYLAMGDTLQKLNQAGQAIENYRRGIAISQSLLAADPSKPETQDDLGILESHLAGVLLASGSPAKAADLLAKARNLFDEATRRDPGNIRIKRNQADMFAQLGDLQAGQGTREASPALKVQRWREARDSFERSMNIWVGMRNRNILWRMDSRKPADLMHSVAVSEVAIAKIGREH